MFLVFTDVKMAFFDEGLIFFIGSKFRVHMNSNVNKYYYLEGVLINKLDFILDMKFIVFCKVNM